ncbi:MAG: large-conductance mechanosensitive channel protein MscL [Phycisphaerales bacterium]|nr:large-conductance mechanosensitive channel protein MscL [Phycisphaerales bacterium]
MGMLSEFRDFALKGNVLDMAIGVIIGGAFGKIVGSLIEDVIMPVVGLAGNVDFSKATLKLKSADPAIAGSTDIFMRYGTFVTVTINFLILAFILFLVVKAFNTAKKRFETQKPAAAPAGPTVEQKLLTEIRDQLAKR